MMDDDDFMMILFYLMMIDAQAGGTLGRWMKPGMNPDLLPAQWEPHDHLLQAC